MMALMFCLLPCPPAEAANKENWRCSSGHSTHQVWGAELTMHRVCINDISTEYRPQDYFNCTYVPDGSRTRIDDGDTVDVYEQGWAPMTGIGPSYCVQGGVGNFSLFESVCSNDGDYWDNALHTCRPPPDPDPDTFDDEEELGQCEVCQGMRGNPVNVATGNNFYVETDYTGAGPFPLVLQRFYNTSDAITSGRMPTTCHATMRARGFSPSASARDRVATTTAAAPSTMPEALPAVTIPSSPNAGLSAERPSSVVSGLM